MPSCKLEVLFVASLVGLSCPLAPAQEITTSYGIDFVTVGDPGNRDSTLEETAFGIPSLHTPRGAVDYEFRIGRTEITTGQWFEFVQAYQPYYESSVVSGDDQFTSPGIEFAFPSGEPIMLIPAARPARVGWAFAARYANWLHNDKATEQWAFETGVYDTSTWAEGPNGEPPENPDVSASPNARFRLPTPDEWIKTVFYDPNRYGEGKGGYWAYPYASDAPLLSTDPGLGGQSDVDLAYAFDDVFPYGPVGSYPDAFAPWGALDVSGSLDESLQGDLDSGGFVSSVDSQRFGFSFDADSLELSLGAADVVSAVTGGSRHGFRLVSFVPTPGVSAALMFFTFMQTIHRRIR